MGRDAAIYLQTSKSLVQFLLNRAYLMDNEMAAHMMRPSLGNLQSSCLQKRIWVWIQMD